MKAITKLALAIALTAFGFSESQAQWGNKKVVGNGNVTTNTVSTGDYDQIKGVGSMDIHLEKGPEGNIQVTTDENLQEYIIVEVNGDELVIRTKKNYNLKTRKGIHVTVPFQDLNGIRLTGSGDVDTRDTIDSPELEVGVTGSGDIDLDVNTGMLDVSVTGSGDIEMRGKTTDLKVRISGSGDFKGFSLKAENTDVSVSGSGDARVVANETLVARVYGSGDIAYKGKPEKSDTKSSGSGDIRSQ